MLSAVVRLLMLYREDNMTSELVAIDRTATYPPALRDGARSWNKNSVHQISDNDNHIKKIIRSQPASMLQPVIYFLTSIYRAYGFVLAYQTMKINKVFRSLYDNYSTVKLQYSNVLQESIKCTKMIKSLQF